MVGEQNAFTCERIQMRRLYRRMTQSGKTFCAPLIGGDEKDVQWRAHEPNVSHGPKRRVKRYARLAANIPFGGVERCS